MQAVSTLSLGFGTIDDFAHLHPHNPRYATLFRAGSAPPWPCSTVEPLKLKPRSTSIGPLPGSSALGATFNRPQVADSPV